MISSEWGRVNRPRSFSGSKLHGDQKVRFIYMDEAGISSSEPVIVVAAIIVDADRQWRRLESCVQDLRDHLGKTHEIGDDFVFHAKDLFHGGRKFPREKWTLQERIEILRRLVSIPRELSVPVVYGHHLRSVPKLPASPTDPAKSQVERDQRASFYLCVIGSEKFMRSEAGKNEVATIVAEDNHQVRATLKKAQKLLSSKRALEVVPAALHDALPISRIVDTVHFASKSEAILLQIADACAYVITRYLSGGTHGEDLYLALTGGIKPHVPGQPGGYQSLVWQSRMHGT